MLVTRRLSPPLPFLSSKSPFLKSVVSITTVEWGLVLMGRQMQNRNMTIEEMAIGNITYNKYRFLIRISAII
jgi:hypothetical protein